MYSVGQRVKAPNGEIGIIKSVQEGNGVLAKGYFCTFGKWTLFMRYDSVTKLEEEPKLEPKPMTKKQQMTIFDIL